MNNICNKVIKILTYSVPDDGKNALVNGSRYIRAHCVTFRMKTYDKSIITFNNKTHKANFRNLEE